MDRQVGPVVRGRRLGELSAQELRSAKRLGLSDARIAAELGTMQVNEEVDALTTLGISPMEFLVLPRMVALFLMMPLLSLYADLMGILGGLIIGVWMLDLNFVEYFTVTRESVRLSDFWVGLVSAAVFGVLVASSGCMRGLRCGRSAAAVGEATTSAVVHPEGTTTRCASTNPGVSTSIVTSNGVRGPWSAKAPSGPEVAASSP